MGGCGSGRWNWHNPKRIVEDCTALAIGRLVRAGLLDHRAGLIEWEDARSGKRQSLGYELEPSDAPARRYLYFNYSPQCETVRQQITLDAKPQPFGGVRWHFFCPLWCGRLVATLYRPPRNFFGCRICHNLTYISAQAHDSRCGPFHRNPPPAWVKRAQPGELYMALKHQIASERRAEYRLTQWSITITGLT